MIRNGFSPNFLQSWFYSFMTFLGRIVASSSSLEVQNRAFFKHVVDAILLNKERISVYSKLSDKASEPLSKQLISYEYGILPVAKVMDHFAIKYQKHGIPVLVDDFVPMEGLVPAKEPISLVGELTEEIGSKYFKVLSGFRSKLFKLAWKKDFKAIEPCAFDSLSALKTLEDETNCSFAMGKHLIESIILTARNGEKFSLMSKGETDRIVSINLILQGIGFFPFCELDIKSAPLHTKGIGFLINDLPQIIEY